MATRIIKSTALAILLTTMTNAYSESWPSSGHDEHDGHGHHSLSTAMGFIKSVSVSEQGAVVVKLDTPHSNPDQCDQNDTVAIAGSHPFKNQLLALILSAQATEKKATFDISGCYRIGNYQLAKAFSGSIADE
jgi:hypothetical protein